LIAHVMDLKMATEIIRGSQVILKNLDKVPKE
jgi:hypothetical protein